jgi:HSP90 family molecular chaperone
MGDTSSLDFMRSRKVFEINPEHEIIKALNVSSQPAGLFHFQIFRLVKRTVCWPTVVKGPERL